MPRREPAALLWDVAQACEGIVRRTAGLGVEAFVADEDLRLICERLLSNACEAVTALHRVDPRLTARIRHARDIMRFRNFIVHAYHLIDAAKLWEIVSARAPDLHEDAVRLLRELEPHDPTDRLTS